MRYYSSIKVTSGSSYYLFWVFEILPHFGKTLCKSVEITSIWAEQLSGLRNCDQIVKFLDQIPQDIQLGLATQLHCLEPGHLWVKMWQVQRIDQHQVIKAVLSIIVESQPWGSQTADKKMAGKKKQVTQSFQPQILL